MKDVRLVEKTVVQMVAVRAVQRVWTLAVVWVESLAEY